MLKHFVLAAWCVWAVWESPPPTPNPPGAISISSSSTWQIVDFAANPLQCNTFRLDRQKQSPKHRYVCTPVQTVSPGVVKP